MIALGFPFGVGKGGFPGVVDKEADLVAQDMAHIVQENFGERPQREPGERGSPARGLLFEHDRKTQVALYGEALAQSVREVLPHVTLVGVQGEDGEDETSWKVNITYQFRREQGQVEV